MMRPARHILVLALLLALAPSAGVAQDEIDFDALRAARKERIARYGLSSRIQRYQRAAKEEYDQGNIETANEILDRLGLSRLNPNERATILRLKAYIANASGDPAAAVDYFGQCLDEEIFSLDADNRIRFSIVQLYVSMEEWQKAIDALEEWFRYAEEPLPQAYYMRALAYFQLEELDLAIEAAETAIDLAPEPQETWLQLLSALFVQKKDYDLAAPVLEELVVRFPKKSYWVQLSLIYAARDGYRESLAVQQVAYAQGLLTEDKEIRRLARGYLYHELPYEAALVLQQGLDDGVIEADVELYEMLANSWIAAREYDRALPPLQTAAELSETGALYVRLGQVHLQREEWDVAAGHLEAALSRGGLDDAGNAQLLLGIALYNAGEIDRARASFMKARRFEKVRPRADGWIAHIENETNAG